MGEKVIKIDQFKSLILKEKIIACDSMLFSYHFHNLLPYVRITDLFFQLLETEKITVVTSTISYLEILSYKELESDISKQLLIQQFFKTIKNLKVYPLDTDIAEEAGTIRRSSSLKIPDAVQLATANIAKAKLFLTNDYDFKNTVYQDTKIILLDEFL